MKATPANQKSRRPDKRPPKPGEQRPEDWAAGCSSPMLKQAEAAAAKCAGPATNLLQPTGVVKSDLDSREPPKLTPEEADHKKLMADLRREMQGVGLNGGKVPGIDWDEVRAHVVHELTACGVGAFAADRIVECVKRLRLKGTI